MSRPPQEPRILRIGEPVRRRVARLRHLDPKSGDTTIDVALVRQIEASLDCLFDDEALALLASGVPDLVKDAGMDIKKVIDRTRGAWARGCPDDLIAIGGHPSGLDFYCVKRKRGEDEPMLIVEFVCADRSLTGVTIVEWLDARLELRREVLSTGDPAERRLAAKLPTAAVISLFQPSLIAVNDEPKITVRRVRHPTFGVGEVLSEIVAGEVRKLNVQFASGTKLLVDRVLEDVEG